MSVMIACTQTFHFCSNFAMPFNFCSISIGAEGTDRSQDWQEDSQESQVRQAGPGCHSNTADCWGHMCGELQGFPSNGSVHTER